MFLGELAFALTTVLLLSALIAFKRHAVAKKSGRQHSPWGAYAGLLLSSPCLLLVAFRAVQYPKVFLVADSVLLFMLPQVALFLLSLAILRRRHRVSLPDN
jgi:hypothetical protein